MNGNFKVREPIFPHAAGLSHRYSEPEMNAANAVWDLLIEKPQRDDTAAE